MNEQEFLKQPILKVGERQLYEYRDKRYVHHNKKSRSQENVVLTLLALREKKNLADRLGMNQEDQGYLFQEAQKHLHNFPKRLSYLNGEGNPELFVSWDLLIGSEFDYCEEHPNNQEFILDKLGRELHKLTVGECLDILWDSTKCNLTTKGENGRLKKFQQNFERDINGWKKIYKKAEVCCINLLGLDESFFQKFLVLSPQDQEKVRSRIEFICKPKKIEEFIKDNGIKHPLETIKEKTI